MSFFSTSDAEYGQLFAENIKELITKNTSFIEANNAKKQQNDLFSEQKKKLDYTAVDYVFQKQQKPKITDFTKKILDLINETIKYKNELALFKQSYYKLNDYWPIIDLVFGKELYNTFALIFHGNKVDLEKDTRNWLFFFDCNFETALQAKLSLSENKEKEEVSPNKFKVIEGIEKCNFLVKYAKKTTVDYSCKLKKVDAFFAKKKCYSLKTLEADQIKTSVAVLDIDEKNKQKKNVKASFSYIEPEQYKSIIFYLKNRVADNYGSIAEILSHDVRFFCDIDDKENKLEKESFVALCKLIVDNFEKCFLSFFADFPEFANKPQIKIRPIALFPNEWKYNSCHLIFHVWADDLPVCFANAAQQKLFWLSFLFLFPELKDIFDLSVYSKNRYMRFPYSYKNGQYLVPSDLICALPKSTNTQQLFICVADEKKMTLDYDCDFTAKQKYWTQFEKRELLRNIRNCDKSIAKRKDWLFLISTICSAFKDETLEFCQELVIKICIAGGFKSEKDIQENMDTTQIYYERKPNTTFMKSIDFFSANCNFDKVDVFEKIDYMTFPKNELETVLVKSGCNTQKTFNFMQNHKTSTFFVTHRCSLSEDYFTTFGKVDINAVHYQDYHKKKAEYFSMIDLGETEAAAKLGVENDKGLFIPVNFVCQLNSIYKFYDIMPYYQRFFFDECAATFKMINFCIDKSIKGRAQYFKMAFDYIIQKKSIFCVSANLGYETFNLLEYYGRKITFSLNNTKLDKSEYYYHLYEDSKEFLEEVRRFILAGKKVIMPCNILKIATDFQNSFKDSEKKILVISKYSELIETDKWKNYDAVLYTAKIDSGVSYMGYEEEVTEMNVDGITEVIKKINGYFDKICGYFEAGVNDSESCFQSLWRARNPKDKDIHIYAKITYGLQGEEWDNEENVLKQYLLVKEELKPIDRLYLDNIYFRNHDRYYFFQNLKKMLDRTGMVNVTHKRAKIIIEKKKVMNKRTKKMEEKDVSVKLPSECIIGENKILHVLPEFKNEINNNLNMHKMVLINKSDSVIFKELNGFFRQIDLKFSAHMLLPAELTDINYDSSKESAKIIIKRFICNNASDISTQLEKHVAFLKIGSLKALNYTFFSKLKEMADKTAVCDQEEKKKLIDRIIKEIKKHHLKNAKKQITLEKKRVIQRNALNSLDTSVVAKIEKKIRELPDITEEVILNKIRLEKITLVSDFVQEELEKEITEIRKAAEMRTNAFLDERLNLNEKDEFDIKQTVLAYTSHLSDNKKIAEEEKRIRTDKTNELLEKKEIALIVDFFRPYRVEYNEKNKRFIQYLEITPQDLFISKSINENFGYSKKSELSFEECFIKYFVDRFTEFNNLFPNAKKKTLNAFLSSKLQYQVSYISKKYDKYRYNISVNKGKISTSSTISDFMTDLLNKLDLFVDGNYGSVDLESSKKKKEDNY